LGLLLPFKAYVQPLRNALPRFSPHTVWPMPRWSPTGSCSCCSRVSKTVVPHVICCQISRSPLGVPSPCVVAG
jgi:hypothetical protein